ncbi:MAG: hypothetical protein OMM_04566 [Candidatus Magnetoglobus multicellularis str. Araruama]|uniref:Uncharacterized protein n=1 Tax=Candidatus Magnetoglobus multicellularis str. Araruama TaxID=890399 RepID=A0A1V1P0U2_9BACT|nr:MAG: hypothetical protein OMM_04566 [Candidatus Magnetoglobus multicellularis str. Araruama]
MGNNFVDAGIFFLATHRADNNCVWFFLAACGNAIIFIDHIFVFFTAHHTAITNVQVQGIALLCCQNGGWCPAPENTAAKTHIKYDKFIGQISTELRNFNFSSKSKQGVFPFPIAQIQTKTD